MSRVGETAAYSSSKKSNQIILIISRSSEEEVIITRMLEKVLKRSDALDRESLCIVAGQQVLTL